MPNKTERSVVVYMLLSLDGVAEEPGDWFFDGGDEVFANLSEVIATQTDVVMGRTTYDYWVDYWPTSDVEPFASFINTTPKHVATSSPLTGTWSNAIPISGSVEDRISELKRSDGGDIGIHGSIGLARSLMTGGFVDELRLVIAPTVAANGERFWDSNSNGSAQRFELVDSHHSSSGTVFAHYRTISHD